VVEDEDALREAVSKHLRIKGFSVMEAADGSAAVDLLHAHGTRIALVLLDVTLPGRPDHEAFEEACRIRKGMKVIVTSAYGENMVAGSFPGMRLEHFISLESRTASRNSWTWCAPSCLRSAKCDGSQKGPTPPGAEWGRVLSATDS
jgi:CheY-like chemotaxis protein